MLSLLAPAAQAAETAAFLEQGIGARAVALGGAGTAAAGDATALYWNPGRLAHIDKRQATFAHAELADSTRLDFGGYAQPLGGGAIGVGFTYLSHGSIKGRDINGRPIGSYGASDAALALGYAFKGEKGVAGASLKYLRSHIAEAEELSVAAFVGLVVGEPSRLAAVALRNLGPGLKYADQRNDLPLAVAAGAERKVGVVLLALDYEYRPRVGQNDAGAGAEWEALNGVFMRGGYSTKGAISGGSGFDAIRGLSLGMGIQVGALRLDYAIKPTGELGRAHRFDLSGRF